MKQLRNVYLWLIVILSIHATMLAWSGYRHSPAWDEVAHLPAGINHWETGHFGLYAVNPPLVRMVAALPVLFCPREKVAYVHISSQDRPEFSHGANWVKKNGEYSFLLFTLARWFCIPFSLLGAWVCFQWARELYGVPSGFLALLLWCFSPLIIGFGSLIVPDVAAASCGIFSCYLFWHWMKTTTWEQTYILGIVLGITELVKFTLLLFYVLWPLMLVISLCSKTKERGQKNWKKQICQIGTCFFISLFMINLWYCFDGTFQQLGQYHFISKTLSKTNEEGHITSDNRFRETWLGEIPIPLPKDYVNGIDIQKRDFEGGYQSYFREKWSEKGWYQYYIYGLCIKEPLGNLILFLFALGLTIFGKRYTARWQDEFFLLFPFFAILLFISAQNGFSHHIRYVIPVLPFAYIGMGKIWRAFHYRQVSVILFSIAMILWSVLSSLYYFPHSMSYFNELIGGPQYGHYHLGNSNTDWGQDLIYLKMWLQEHPEVKVDSVAYDLKIVQPSIISNLGICPKPQGFQPHEGWHIVSVNQIHHREGKYLYFLKFEPVTMIGYTMYVYHLTCDDILWFEKTYPAPKNATQQTLVHIE